MSGGITVRTGSGVRVAVDPAELVGVADRVSAQAVRFAEITASAAGLLAAPELVTASLPAPAEGATAVGSLAELLATSALAAARLTETAVQLQTAALAYEVGEAAAGAVLAAARARAGATALALAPFALGATAQAAGVFLVLDLAHRAGRLTLHLVRTAGAGLADGELDETERGALRSAAVDGLTGLDEQVAGDAVRVLRAGGAELAEHPDLVQALVELTPEVVRAGAAASPLFAAVVAQRSPELLLAGDGSPDKVAADAAGVARLLTGLAAVAPVFGATAVSVTRLPPGRGTPARAPTGVAEILQGVRINSGGWSGGADLASRLAPAAPPPPGTVRVEQVVRGGRRSWIVEIPGTQTWRAGTPVGGTPMDLTANLDLVAGSGTAVEAGVVEAMRQAGIAPGEPVLLAGHSQGGLTAAAVAADPRLREEFTVTHVLTAGSPVDGIPVPSDVRVLQLEHTGDLVPRLDGVRAGGGEGRIVVTADVGAGLAAHESDAYLRTARAVDASDDPALRAYLESAAPFLDAPGTTVTATDYRLTRR
ncbi:hypothetical protein ACFFKU_00905 [Kineococcus gynurae]|uniref:PGAP1-like protein n=1 Tax=Kineococcus gynurae TaxID=452979 RepID=A0ABV5LPW2_9ACTN